MKKIISVFLSIMLLFSTFSFTITKASAANATHVTHSYSNACDSSCNLCGELRDVRHRWAPADCTTPATCYICYATIGVARGHTYDDSCDSVCNSCNETRTIKHTYKTISTTKATTSKDGKVIKQCAVCSKTSTNKIYYANKVKLSTTKYTYNGKTKKPSVNVYNYKGDKISSSNYTISYKNNKNIGKATVTIKLKGNYSGTLKTTFKIVPAGSKIEKLTAARKSLKVKIKKVSSQPKGYEIQYSTNKTFKSKYTKTKKVTNCKTTSVTLKNLKAKKTYYVRVRTYKTVGKTKYYSGWSTYKYIKTK